jgi:pimeloyl-ACP methyl ester carboxylesterase
MLTRTSILASSTPKVVVFPNADREQVPGSNVAPGQRNGGAQQQPMKGHSVTDQYPSAAAAETYTFVLVHGGCHDGSLWQPTIDQLRRRGHTAYGPTVAGHGQGVPKTVTHAEQTQSVVDFIVDNRLSDIVLVGHGYAGTIISKVAEAIPSRVRRLVFWSAYVLDDGESALEMQPEFAPALTEMARSSTDNTFMIPFKMWRDLFINDGDADLVARAYAQLSPEPFGPWTERLEMTMFHRLTTPRSFLVGSADHVMSGEDSGWHPRMSRKLRDFRLVRMPGSHEALFTDPGGLAVGLVEAGRDDLSRREQSRG